MYKVIWEILVTYIYKMKRFLKGKVSRWETRERKIKANAKNRKKVSTH